MKTLIVIGSSLGGIEALKRVLGPLDPELDAPVLVVQHRRPDDSPGLANLLARHVRMPVTEAEDHELLRTGRVILAPPDYHLLVDGDRVALSLDGPVHFSRPSIDVLFQSAAQGWDGSVVGILLTAASRDGARGLRSIARRGGRTLVQSPDEAESGIAPRAALALYPDHEVLRVGEIGRRILELVPGPGSTKRPPPRGARA